MSACYSLAHPEITSKLNRAIALYHPRLAHVTFDVLTAESKIDDDGEIKGDGYPVKVNGYPAYAAIKIIGLKDRAAGRSDVEIVIDGDQWDRMDDATHMALFDHELTHIEIDTIDGTNIGKTDDLNRPKLKMRKHDYQFGWFSEVAERHGKSSIEIRQFRQLTDPDTQEGQLWFSFLPDIETAASAA